MLAQHLFYLYLIFRPDIAPQLFPQEALFMNFLSQVFLKVLLQHHRQYALQCLANSKLSYHRLLSSIN